MAMVQSLDHYWTPEEVRALPDDGTRHECIDGLLIVTPGPTRSISVRSRCCGTVCLHTCAASA